MKRNIHGWLFPGFLSTKELQGNKAQKTDVSFLPNFFVSTSTLSVDAD